jgi:DNA repair protein RecO (recombination protein O)
MGKAMFYTTKGLILRETNYKDNDKLLSVLTEELGLITAKARGVRRKNSPLRSGCQLLSYSELTLFEKNGYYSINEAEPINMFMGLRSDIELLALGSYFAQLLETVCGEGQPDPELLSLGLNCLYGLSVLHKPQALVKAAFELRLLSLAGYRPHLEGCADCGRPDASRFYLQSGVLICGDCGKSAESSRQLSPGVLAAMRHIATCDKQRLLAFSLPEQSLKELGQVTEAFLLCQLDQGFSSLSFYKRLFITI